MEMSPAYLGETAKFLEGKGFSLDREETDYRGDGAVVGRKFVLRRDSEHLILEVVEYQDGAPKYFLKVENYHGLSTFSFPLDSWKHRPDRVEFKYVPVDDTGLGLSFTIDLREALED